MIIKVNKESFEAIKNNHNNCLEPNKREEPNSRGAATPYKDGETCVAECNLEKYLIKGKECAAHV